MPEMPNAMKAEPWDEVSEGVPDRRRLFTVRSDVVRFRLTGREHTVDRLIAPAWVNVVAITERDEMLFVRQWRFGSRTFTLEIPAGLNEPGEEPLPAGQRELLEETGYAGPDARTRRLLRPSSFRSRVGRPRGQSIGPVCPRLLPPADRRRRVHPARAAAAE